MKSINILVFFNPVILLLFSCAGLGPNPVFESAGASPEDQVTYTGIFSCPDCSGPNLMLKLKSDSTYEAEIHDIRTGEIIRQQGVYTWKKKQIALAGDSLLMPLHFLVNKKQLLEAEQKTGSGMVTVLTQLENSLAEINWKLIELNGNLIRPVNDPVRYPHFILKLLSNRIVGNGGCNGFSGYYEIHKPGSIRFSDLISTKMACMEVNYENEFFEAIKNSDNYLVHADTLHLKKSGRILAKLIIAK